MPVPAIRNNSTIHPFVLALSLAFALGAAPARASTLSALGGVSLPPPVSSGFGAEYTLNLSSHCELGAFFDQNYLTLDGGAPATLRFYGGVVRLHGDAPGGFFADVKLGMSRSAVTDSDAQPAALGAGAGIGAGYRVPLTAFASLSPRIGGRDLGGRLLADLNLLFSIHF